MKRHPALPLPSKIGFQPLVAGHARRKSEAPGRRNESFSSLPLRTRVSIRAAGSLAGGDQLPTVRQAAVDLSINPNTVVRAYRELEIRGVLETQQGTGTFISHQKVKRDEVERQRRLNQLVGEFVSRAGSAGFTVKDLLEQLHDLQGDSEKTRR